MSAINGDKARFNRNRKAKIARRTRNRKRFPDLKQQSSSNAPGTQAAKVAA
jgi:hypothetical protein